MPSSFNSADVNALIERLNSLTPSTQPVWGKMDVARMLAHVNVSYEMAYENIHPKPNIVARFLLRTFVKSTIVGDKPYKKDSPTAPAFKIVEARDFEREKQRLVDHLQKTQGLGASYFEGKESLSLGALTAKEWDTMFYKHIDHHFSQFGV